MTIQKLILSVGSGLLAASVVAGCADPPPMILVRGATPVIDNCVAEASPSAFLGSGVLDVSIASGYVLYPNLENISPTSSSTGPQQQGAGGGTGATWPDLDGETNRVVITTAKVSFNFRTSGIPGDVSSAFAGFEYPVGGPAVDPGGGTATVQLPVLNAQHINALKNILQPDQTILLEVSVQVLGESSGDREVESNAFVFPIQICSECLVDSTCPADEGVVDCHRGQDSRICTGAVMP